MRENQQQQGRGLGSLRVCCKAALAYIFSFPSTGYSKAASQLCTRSCRNPDPSSSPTFLCSQMCFASKLPPGPLAAPGPQQDGGTDPACLSRDTRKSTEGRKDRAESKRSQVGTHLTRVHMSKAGMQSSTPWPAPGQAELHSQQPSVLRIF